MGKAFRGDRQVIYGIPTLLAYDLENGKQLFQKSLTPANSNPGNNQLAINTKELQLAAGVYFLRFSAGGFEKTIKLVP